MKNVTVSLDDELYRQARIAAAETGSSVTALVREFLIALTASRASPVAPDPAEAILATVERIRQRHPGFDPAGRLDRDEIHAR